MVTRRAMSLIEGLEGRRLLASVSWDGGAGTNRWGDPLNWSNDVLPTVDDDVTVAAAVSPYASVNIPVNIRSLTVTGRLAIYNPLTVTNGLTVKTGGTVNTAMATIGGGGTVTIETGANWLAELAGSGLPFRSSDVLMPVDNYGTYQVSGGKSMGTTVHNYGTIQAYEGGNYFGNVVNESTGVLLSKWLPNYPDGTVIFGIAKNSAGTIVAAPFVNRGHVYTSTLNGNGTGEPTVVDNYGLPMQIYMDATPTIGGKWNASYGNITFTSLSTATPASVSADPSFNFASGTLSARNINLTLGGLADGTGLRIYNGTLPTTVNLVQPRTSLALLQLLGGTLKLGTGNRVLRAPDVGYAAGATLDVGDGTFIDGNQPKWGTAIGLSAPGGPPVAVPAYADAVRATVGGQTLTVRVNNAASTSATQGIGYTRGDALLTRYPAGTFNGEAFDGNDLVFRSTLRGDADLDRDVDFDDLLALAAHYGTTTARGVADGNLTDSANASGSVDFDDLLLLATTYGKAFAVAPALETATRPTRTTRTTSDVLN